jgi:hypothetical protein
MQKYTLVAPVILSFEPVFFFFDSTEGLNSVPCTCALSLEPLHQPLFALVVSEIGFCVTPQAGLNHDPPICASLHSWDYKGMLPPQAINWDRDYRVAPSHLAWGQFLMWQSNKPTLLVAWDLGLIPKQCGLLIKYFYILSSTISHKTFVAIKDWW